MPLLVRRLALAALVLSALGAHVTAQSCEIVHRVDGKTRKDKGECESHTFKGLGFKRTSRSTLQLINEDELISVTYARTPDGYDKARALLDEGKPREALAAFETALADVKRTTEWARQEILWQQSQIELRLGHAETARELGQRLLDEIPDSRYVPHVMLRRADDLYAAVDFPGAAKAYGALFDEAKSKGFAPSFVARAARGRVRSLIRAGNLEEATAALAAARAANLAGDLATDRIALAEAELAAAGKDYEKAKGSFQALQAKAASAPEDAWKNRTAYLLAGAANGLGDVAFEQGEYEKATVHYSKVFALYGDEPELAGEVGWSLWRFAEASKRLSNAAAETDDAMREHHARRHFLMRRRAADDYPNTLGGALARREQGRG